MAATIHVELTREEVDYLLSILDFAREESERFAAASKLHYATTLHPMHTERARLATGLLRMLAAL